MLGGAYHPAFRELCEGHIYLQKMREALKDTDKSREYDIFVPEKALSKAKGQNKRNEKALKNDGFYCKIKGKNSLQDFEVEVAQTV